MTQVPRAELLSRLKIGLRAAEQAGAVLMRHRGQEASMEGAAAARREAAATVLSELRAAFRTDVVAATAIESQDHLPLSAAPFAIPQWRWFIESLDGARAFATNGDDFCVSLGLVYGAIPVLGIVLAPARRQIFVGGSGVPATCNQRAIAVSRESVPGPTPRKQPNAAVALDLCAVASGSLVAFGCEAHGPGSVVGACAIIVAAGGEVTDPSGAPLDVASARVLASNGRAHAEWRDRGGTGTAELTAPWPVDRTPMLERNSDIA